ncbi:MAG: tetratricopeptide repeat protein [Proteobacteria bacterium]|jgi:tetratricopeptide (TPR) repeat protein|nr:tetratricopeptide repeat protein [Pseudomonadota bacterium]
MSGKPLLGVASWKKEILEAEARAEAASTTDGACTTQLEVARLWEGRFLQKAKAIVHFQQAYKAEPKSREALGNARRIYWEMGRLPTVEKLATIERDLATDPAEQLRLLRELAEVRLLLGQTDQIHEACDAALAIEKGARWAADLAKDLDAGDGWTGRAAKVAKKGEKDRDAGALLRAAVMHWRAGGDTPAAIGLLKSAVRADPRHASASLLTERLVAEEMGEDALLEWHAELLSSVPAEARAGVLYDIGLRWLLQRQNAERALRFLDQAFRSDPAIPGLLGFLCDTYGESGDTAALADLVEAGLEKAQGDTRLQLLEIAGELWGTILADPAHAERYFTELLSLAPDNGAAKRFFEESEMTKDSGSNPTNEPEARDESTETAEGPADRGPSEALRAAMQSARAAESQGAEAGIKAWQEAWNTEPGHPAVLEEMYRLFSETGKWTVFADFIKKATKGIANEDHSIAAQMVLARVYDLELKQDVMAVNTYQAILKQRESHMPALDAAIEKYEAMERWPDLVKMLKAKGALVTSPEDKVDIWLRVAQLFLQRFSNQAEAIKAFEEVIAADPDNVQAADFLKEMYEKRRDWEKLIAIKRREAERAAEGPDRAAAYVEVAKMASERLKKPSVCIELWEAVVAQDGENAEAFNELAGLYERAKEWEKLAAILEKQAAQAVSAAAQAEVYQKLGIVYGDKIGDNNRAVTAWKALMAINPDDRRAQEQLKKRYLALQAWDELEEFYGSAGKWDEFIRVLEREAERPDATAESKIGLQFKIAELWRDRKERVDRAAKCYEIVLELDKQNLRAAEALIPILEESGKEAGKLADVLEVKLVHVTDADEQLALIQRISHIAEDDVADVGRAFQGFLRAFTLRPDDETTRADMERTAGKAGKWEEVAAAYATVFGASKEPLKLEIRLCLGRVLNEELGRAEEALAHYDAILSQDPKNPRAVHALERIFAQMGRYEELLDIYTRRIEMAADDEERKEIFYNQALLWEEEIGDVDKAIAVYNQIIEMAGDEPKALAALDRLFTKAERWKDAAEVIDRQLQQGVLQEEQEIEFKFRLGQVKEIHLGDKAGALECYREVLTVRPSHDMSTAALEGLLEDAAQQAEAASILAPIYQESGEWEKLVQAIEILFKRSDDAFEKLEHLMRIGGIFSEHLGSPERAFVAYSRAFRLNPNQAAPLDKLEEITTILDCWKEMVGLLEEGGRTTDDPEIGKQLWLRAARIHDAQLDNVDAAVAAYNAVLALDAQNTEAIAALEQIFSRTERWPELIDVLRTKVDATVDAGEKEQIFRHMVMIYEEMLERPQDAVGCLKEILGIDPTNAQALQDLDKLYLQLENWADLADNLQQQLGIETDPDRTVALKLRLASLRESRLSEVAAAVEIYREVIEVDPENATAIEALERIIEKPEFKRDIALMLEPIYRGIGAWQKLVNVYEILISLEEGTSRKVDLLHEIAALYETAGDEPEKAFQTLGRALAVEPAEERTQESLERLSRVLVLHAELADLYEKTIEGAQNMELAAAFHLKIARIAEESLQDLDRAVRHYREVLAIDPMHLDAATALERAYQINENYAELAAIYLRKVEMVSDLTEQKNLLFKASQIYEELLENAEKAIEVYLKILDIDGDDLRAIAQLEGLYLRLERWEELQGIYNRKADLVTSPEDKKEVLYVLGAMYERELKDVKKATETYQRILEFDPDDFQAVQRLDVLFTESGEWHDLLSVLEREVELTGDPEEAVAFKYRIAELYVRHLDDVSRAVEYFKDILTLSAGHDPSIGLLEELVKGDREPLLAAEVLEPLYQDLAEWRKLIGVLEVKLKATEEPWQKVELLHQIAGLLESDLHLDSPSEAFDVYARAIALDKTNEKSLLRLEDLAAQTGRWPDLAQLIDAQLKDADSSEVVVPLGLRVAAVYEEKLDKVDEAIVRYQRVLELENDNRQAILRLDKLFQITERWADLAAVLVRESAITQDPDESLGVQFRLGQLYRQEIGDLDRAVEVFRDILAAEPAHEKSIAALELLFAEGQKRGEIVEILEPLFRMQAEWQKLVSLYQQQLDDVTDVAARVPMIHRIAETLEERIVDQVEAFNWYSRAFAEDPFDERSGEEIERLARATNAWPELADLYQDLFEKREDAQVKRLAAKRLARVAEEELHDAARAEQAYRGCLQLGGDDFEVLTALDRIYTQYMEWDRLVDILEMLATTVPSDEEKVAYIYRMGTVFETQMDEPEKARVAYHRVVDKLDPSHRDSLDRLEMIYANREAWTELYAIYEKMKESTQSEAAQADLYAKLGVIASDCLGDIPRAIELWKNVLDIRGEDPLALDALADMYSRQENWSDLVDILERAVTIADDTDTRVRLYSQLGMVWGQCLSRDRNALDNWQNVLGIEPTNIPALQAIAGIYEANKEWDDLIDALERIISAGASQFEVAQLKGYFAKLGTILDKTLERPMDAIDAWRKAAELDLTDLGPLTALEQLYSAQAMWEELVVVLGKKGEVLEGDAQIETWLEQAKIIEEKLEEPRQALKPYGRIIDVAPLHVHAFERMVEILTDQDKWDDLIKLYSTRLNFTGEPADQVALMHKAAAIYEDKLSQPENAFQVMQRAFETDYSNDETAKHLERLASITDSWNELLASCNQVLQSIQDKKTQVNLCLKIGKWYADELGHPEYAIAYYQQVLQLDADNVRALTLMGQLYRGTKQWAELVEVLGRAVSAEQEPDRKKAIYVELGQIYEEYLSDLPEARKAYKQALDIDPGLEAALNALERMFAASQNWRELIPVLRRKLDVLAEPEQIVATRLRIAEIFEDQLGDAQSAIDEYRKNLEVEQGNMPSLKGLERLFSKASQWQDLLDVLEIQLEYATSERIRIELLTRVASMLEEEFLSPDKAIPKYEQILEIDPAHESALGALERLYRSARRWQDLIATLERHVVATNDRDARIGLYGAIGVVYAAELDDNDRAMEAYRAILDIDPEHLEALDQLSRAQVKAEDWSGAHETMRRLADTLTDAEAKVDLYYRLGKLNEENLMDRATAVEHFRSAIDINAGHLPSLEALSRIHLDEGEWLAAARVLDAEQQHTENTRQKSRLQFELGELTRDKLMDEDTGIQWFERSLESDPDNQKAAEPLVDVYIARERWQDAERLLDMLLRLGGKRDARELQPLHRKLGLVADKVGNLEKALKAYQTAYDMDTAHLPTLLALADVLYRQSEWDKAFKLYQMVLVHHREAQGKDEIVDIFYRLGRIKAEVQERRKALNMFDKALEIDPAHKPTLEQVVALHEEQKNYEQVIHFKKILVDNATDDDDKFQLLVDIGDIWQEKMKNPQKAISSYAEASELKPENRPVLHKMLPLYQSTKQWQKVVEIIGRVAEMEEDQDKLGRLYYSMAVIYRDEIKSADDSVELFNKSLDASLENLKSFEAVDRILTQKKDWKELERNYRKMLHRIAGKDRKDLEINLWHFLGEIYRSRMGQFDSAAEAFKMASSLDPDNVLRHEILAELFMKMPDRLNDAVAEHQELIRKNPYRVDSYKALRKLYFDHRQYDKAWCLCATLSFLKKADPEEQQFFDQYRTRGTIRAQARLDNEIWVKNLFHPDESVFMGKIFELVTRAVRTVKVQPIKAFGLKKTQKRPPNDTLTISKTFYYATQVINLPVVPELYVQEDRQGGLNFALTDPMASACGASLMSGYSPQDLLFIVTKHLSYYRPEHYIRWVLPTQAELKLLLLASLKIGAPDFKLPEDKSGVLAQYVDVLRQNLSTMEAENLGKVVRRFIKSGEQADIKKWVRSLELTACRAGYLLANDLETAAKMIQAETGGVDDIPPKEKIKELVLFSVSEEYFKLREALGIVIGS